MAQIFCLKKYFLYYLLISFKVIPGMMVYCFLYRKSFSRLIFSLNLRTNLIRLPLGTFIFNITSSLNLFKNFTLLKAKYSVAAGTSAKIWQHGIKFIKLKLASGSFYCLLKYNFCSTGVLTNKFWKNQRLNIAGRKRHLGKKQRVRGVAMNAVDHPHGGGRGKTKGKSLTPWGLHSLNSPTRKSKKKKIWSFLVLPFKYIKYKKKKLNFHKHLKKHYKLKCKLLQRVKF